MTNINNDPQKPNPDEPLNETVNARPATNEEVAYRDGYTSGQIAEDRLRKQEELAQQENQRVRDNENASRGLLLGLLLAALIAIVGGLAFLFTESQRSEPTVPTAVPVPVEKEEDENAEQPTPENNTTIIERTIEKTKEVVPAPQQQPSPAPDVEVNTPAPEVEVNVPQPSAPEREAPSRSPEQPQSPQTETAPDNQPASQGRESTTPQSTP
ncbi:hypothetical protein IQ249_21495 [Lusitaniella coriacea LEGE 07157]|uniref:Uncharacterized protein n=1 Tax=Lusitaniella coriacea LEGE 07157 TaxID=945747 RepID=A0A8J7E4Q8_9CYAN|nr:hypothetical protein [Lusitaniella coriacea]MBE9118469.1 hypothetical protein [Lusitaniella coriacea LEGE 07157]